MRWPNPGWPTNEVSSGPSLMSRRPRKYWSFTGTAFSSLSVLRSCRYGSTSGRMWRIWARKKCSRSTTRSMTSSNEAGGGEDRVAALCPAGAGSIVAAGGAEDGAGAEDAAGGAEDVESRGGSCGSAGKAQTNKRKNESEPARKIRIKTFKGFLGVTYAN